MVLLLEKEGGGRRARQQLDAVPPTSRKKDKLSLYFAPDAVELVPGTEVRPDLGR